MHSRSRSVAGVASKCGISNSSGSPAPAPDAAAAAAAALGGADASAAVAAVISCRRCRTLLGPRAAGRRKALAALRREDGRAEAAAAATDRGRAD